MIFKIEMVIVNLRFFFKIYFYGVGIMYFDDIIIIFKKYFFYYVINLVLLLF